MIILGLVQIPWPSNSTVPSQARTQLGIDRVCRELGGEEPDLIPGTIAIQNILQCGWSVIAKVDFRSVLRFSTTDNILKIFPINLIESKNDFFVKLLKFWDILF